ncbi:MAG TPA: hypothetical protein VFA51_05765 [Candidatus Udaeobacter sp.]|nr:hypothetical protein [Candidatus Udaeobacter sp.]
MTLRISTSPADGMQSNEEEGGERVQNSTMPLHPLLPPVEPFCSGGTTLARDRHSVACNRRMSVDMVAFTSRCFPRTIQIPTRLRGQPLEALSRHRRISTRLAHVLQRSGIGVLGTLNGLRVGDFAWEKNCGLKTLHELDSVVSALTNGPSSCHGPKTNGEVTTMETALVVPKSVRGLRFDQLPITRRLGNVIRTAGFQTLGHLHGQTLFDLLQRRSCGWRTVIEVQRLIARAVSGEFDIACMEKSRALSELLTLLERGITNLPPLNKQFLLARIEGKTFARIGKQHGFTRAYAHRVVMKTLGILTKTYGPRIPELLRTVKQHYLPKARASRLTPSLLDQWLVNSSPNTFRLSRETQVHLLAALDKSIPWSSD